MRSLRIGYLGGAAATATAIVLAILLTGCSGLSTGALPGSPPLPSPTRTFASGSGSTSDPKPSDPKGSDPKGSGCTANGTAIPDGHYTGKVDVRITTTMSINTGGIAISHAGSGDERWQGTVDIVSTGGKVTGTLTLSELGVSQVGLPSSKQVHSVDTSDFTGKISGPSSKPVVAANLTGEWASLDAPVINGKGTSNENVTAGLHITQVSCESITGNAVAMFADIAAPVAQYIAISGSGAWTAKRT
jgi:major membrane immunogen (membrane-anchored lipoprotein)